MNKYVILSTDNNPDYYNLLPLVCHSWNKIGYTPVIIWLAGKALLPVMDDVMDAKILLHEEKFGVADGVKKSTIAQLGRLFAHEWEMFNNDDVLITADADMVIARDIFTHDVSQGQIISYGFDLTGRSELPICYVKATAEKWAEMMGGYFIPQKSYSDKWEDYWSVDQQLLTQMAKEYGMNRITFIDRGNQNKHGLPTGRWDRHDWAHMPDSIIDVHMKRNDWEAQIQVAERLWPGEDHSFIAKFREALEGKDIGNVDLSPPPDIDTIIERPVQIDIPDEFGFLNTTGNWDNHRPLLLLGLFLTNGYVVEFGSGEGSTKSLREYCAAHQRAFSTYDNNEEWAEKTGSVYVRDWGSADVWHSCGLLFIDHAPGEHRKVAIERMIDSADIIVVHDTEQGGAGDYGFEPVFAKFKYRLNYNKTGGGAGATMVSNKIDVNQFRGLSLGQYTFDKD
jgi:hypothetical protein